MNPEVSMPSGWSISLLKNVADYFIDGDWIETPFIEDSGVRLIQTGNIGIGNFVNKPGNQRFISRRTYHTLRCHAVEVDDILICRLADPVGRACQIPDYVGPAITSVDCTIFRPDNSIINPRFALHWFTSPQHLKSASDKAGGSTRKRISRKNLGSLPIPLPPLKEQEKIAQILDASDEAIRSTECLIIKLEQARQGLLRELLASAIVESGKARPLGDVSIIAGGLTLGRSISGSESIELPYLRVANVQDGFIDTSEMKWVRILRTELERYRLHAGDVLMTEGGDFDKLGRGAVWDGSIDPCLHQNHIFRVRCDPSVLLPQFLAMYSASPAGRRHFVMISKQTTNLASINMTQLKAFPLPIPPLQEQARIIAAAEVQDNEIRGELQVLRKLRLLKLGLMDDLLTGRVRVGASA